MGNLFAITGRIIVDYRWRAAEIPPLTVKDRSYNILWSTCLSWRFVLKRFCILNWVTKILMRAISNVHADRTFPTFWLIFELTSAVTDDSTFETSWLLSLWEFPYFFNISCTFWLNSIEEVEYKRTTAFWQRNGNRRSGKRFNRHACCEMQGEAVAPASQPRLPWSKHPIRHMLKTLQDVGKSMLTASGFEYHNYATLILPDWETCRSATSNKARSGPFALILKTWLVDLLQLSVFTTTRTYTSIVFGALYCISPGIDARNMKVFAHKEITNNRLDASNKNAIWPATRHQQQQQNNLSRRHFSGSYSNLTANTRWTHVLISANHCVTATHCSCD